MGHAQRKQESLEGRTVLPPALPTRSGIAPKATGSAARSARSIPPAPPLAALNSTPAPKSPLPASDLRLALLPQWVDANAPLLPAKKSRFGLGFWIGSTSVSMFVGALVAAGLLHARLPESLHTSPQPQHVAAAPQAQPAAREEALLQPLAAEAKPDMEIGTDEAFAAAAPSIVVVPELTLTAKKRGSVTKVTKATKVAKTTNTRARGPKAASVVSTSWQPEPEATQETAAPAATEPAASEAAPESAPAPEPVAAPEPPKPVLPEQLTREQVRKGMEAKRNAVITCAKGAYGKVLADITIAPSGKVSSSVIDGTFAGTSVGSCMSSALRGAQFPEFSGPEIQVRYPFSF